MSILGVGTDLVNIKRIEAILKKKQKFIFKKNITPQRINR